MTKITKKELAKLFDDKYSGCGDYEINEKTTEHRLFFINLTFEEKGIIHRVITRIMQGKTIY